MNTTNRRSLTHRGLALGLATLFTSTMLASIQHLAVQPAPDSLLARQGTPAHLATAAPAASARS